MDYIIGLECVILDSFSECMYIVKFCFLEVLQDSRNEISPELAKKLTEGIPRFFKTKGWSFEEKTQ